MTVCTYGVTQCRTTLWGRLANQLAAHLAPLRGSSQGFVSAARLSTRFPLRASVVVLTRSIRHLLYVVPCSRRSCFFQPGHRMDVRHPRAATHVAPEVEEEVETRVDSKSG